MKLIIGLGNPEERYNNTRHNVGFTVLSAYAKREDAEFLSKDKFKAHLAELSVSGEKIILVKPTTYYNNVGESARLLADFYKVEPADILVVHDELALPFGTVRTRIGGSDAGNNGVKSITAHTGTETARLRIGVYNELRDTIDDANFVLGQWSKTESEQLPEVVAKSHEIIDSFINGSFEHTSHKAISSD